MVIIQIGDYVLEEDIDLLLVCLGEYIKNIDGEEFKKIFLGYVEYMARNYGQDCIIDEYDQMITVTKKIVEKYHLNLSKLKPYKRDLLYRWVKAGVNEEDILALYYLNDKVNSLEVFIDMIEKKYNRFEFQ